MMTLYRDLIERVADAHELDPNLVEAIVVMESAGMADAFRFEPAFYRTYLQKNAHYAGQIPRRVGSSYGLMQVMFSTAEEHGYTDVPEKLFIPEIGLEYGCRCLARLVKWSGGNVRQAVAAYNGGRGGWREPAPQAYADRVLATYRAVEKGESKDRLA